MASLILIKRGLEANLPILERGELAFATDTKRLFIGVLAEPTQVSDNVLISSIDDFYTKTETASLVGTGLLWDSQAEEFNIAFASEEEAGTGSNETKVMSPLRTAQAIAAQTNSILTTGQYITQTNLNNTVAGLGGTGLTVTNGVINIDNAFDPSGNYELLRARGTLAEDVGLEEVTNESKATMFNNPTFTNTVTIAGDNPKLTGLPIPTDSTDAANKTYVDNVASGLKGRTSALVLVDFNLDATYDGVPELAELEANTNVAFPDVDGILSAVLNVEDTRFLLIGQTNKAHNGLYVLKTAGVTGTSPWVLRRCRECATSEAVPGSYIFIQKGDTYKSTAWVLEVDNPLTFTIGTDDINAVQFSGTGTFTDGNGLTLTGTEFSIDTTVTMDLPTAQTVTGVKTFDETIIGAVTGIQETNTEENNRIMSVWVGTESEYNTQTNTGANADNNTLYFIEE